MNKKKIYIRKLIWDKWNIAHIARHNILPEEVEAVCEGEPVEREGYKQRIFLIGPTMQQRMLTVILEPTEQEYVYRPITAYDASRRSRQDYADEKNQGGEGT